MRSVYVIVLMESSPAKFRDCKETYIHHSDFRLNSGISIQNLMNFIYISLDNFLKIPHNELTELEAWLYFLSSDNPLHIQQIISKYPFFKELYRDIIDFRYNPKELIHMYRIPEALLVADRNTANLMIDDLKQDVAKKEAELVETKAELAEKNTVISEKDAVISEKDAVISEKDAVISEKDAEIERLRIELAKQATTQDT